MAEKVNWTPTMDYNFITTYVDWVTTKTWDIYKTQEQNYNILTTHLRENFEMLVLGKQCLSRMHRFKKKWYYFSHLKRLSTKSETGLGWDEENNCFTASNEHWPQLEEVNGDYKDFKLPGSCFLYDIYTPTTWEKIATGSYAQSASEPIPMEPPKCIQPVAKRKSRKGKTVAPSSMDHRYNSFPWEGENVYYVPLIPGEVMGKRPVSSFGTACEHEGSRGTKSTRSLGYRERLDNAISKLSRFTAHSMDYKKARHDESAKYSVPVVQDIVKVMDLPRTVKLKATMYFAKDENQSQRIAYIRFDESQRYEYIGLIMEELGQAVPPS